MSHNSLSFNAGSQISNSAYILPENQAKTTVQKSNNKKSVDDPVIARVPVTLENKPPRTSLGEHLNRQALNKIVADYGLRSEDVELEIQYIKEKEDGKFIEELNFNKTAVKNPNDLTDLQVADLIKNGHKTVEFGIHQATIERMVKRDELVKWLAQKDALNISMSEEDVADLKNLGYTPSDVAKIRDAKYMQYWGLREKALADVNEIAKQKLIADRIEELEKNPEQVIKEGDNTTSSRVEFLIRTTATREINDALTNSKMTPLEYTADKKSLSSHWRNCGRGKKRSRKPRFQHTAKEGLKNGINGVYWSIGETLKGAAVLGNALRRYDEDGNKLDTKASDALLYKAGDWTQKTINLPVDKDIERTLFGGIIPKTVGGVLPYLFGSWATATPRATTAVLAGLSTGGATYDEAKRYDASETNAQNSALLTGGFIGITSTLGYGKTLKALNSGAGAKTWQTIFSEAVKDGARNSVIAGGQTIFENGVAKQLYDPNRSYFENVQERMIAAGITGATLNGGLEIIAKVRMGRNPQVLAETQKILKVKPEIETLTSKQIELKNSGSALKAKLNEKLDNVNSRSNIKQTIAQKEAVKLIKQANDTEPAMFQYIMNDLKDVSKQTNGEMIGLEYRFKSEESLTRKITDRSNRVEKALIKQGKTPAEAKQVALTETVTGVNDALRYTMSFPKEKYYSSYEKTIEILEKQGYKVEAVANFWSKSGTRFDTGYRGINTTLLSPTGQKFELQFHTPESFKLKMDTHSLYEEARIPTTLKARKDEIRKVQIEMADKIPVPVQNR